MGSDPRIQMCEAGRRLHARNLLAAGDGNLSVRVEDGTILITPTGIHKARLDPERLAILDPDGRTRMGSPSSEARLHLAIYETCPEARAVAHAHPPHTIAWTLARPDLNHLPCEALPEGILATGGVPILPYARPGSSDVADGVRPWAPRHRVLVLARHGAVAWGESLDEACDGLERLEHMAQILWAAEALGGAHPLPDAELRALWALRERLGPKLR